MVRLDDARVIRARFPIVTSSQQGRLSDLVQAELPKWYLFVSLDQLVTSLDMDRTDRRVSTDLIMAPPRIIYLEEPAVLVSIAGIPVLRPIENSGLKRVVNTPFLIVFDPWIGKYFLYGGLCWYTSIDLRGLWNPTRSLPPRVKAIDAKLASSAGEIPVPSPESGPAPRIVVATEPSELIATDGPARFATLVEGQVEYATNTESDILRDTASGDYFLLLSGRWYHSATLNGPWAYLSSGRVPDGFRIIPPDSPKGHVLAHIGGTTDANDAVIDAQVPQTASIRRGIRLEVKYDGPPTFRNIAGTAASTTGRWFDSNDLPYVEHLGSGSRTESFGHTDDPAELEYAINTSSAVVKSGDKYYACDQAVWFVGRSPYGPWSVADDVPVEIYGIPPSCPIYPVTYVRIYWSDRDVVCVGYTSGYLGSYAYNGTVVYGTGYSYPAWSGSDYYCREVTWGFNARYDAIGGSWDLAIGSGHGWLPNSAVCHPWQGYGWFGTDGYHGRASPGCYFEANSRNSRGKSINNIYRRTANLFRNVDINAIPPYDDESLARKLKNNVYAGLDGNVYRETSTGWLMARRKGWVKVDWSARQERPTRRQRGPDFDKRQLERESAARRRGMERTRVFRLRKRIPS
jgi:hypothetical protein